MSRQRGVFRTQTFLTDGTLRPKNEALSLQAHVCPTTACAYVARGVADRVARIKLLSKSVCGLGIGYRALRARNLIKLRYCAPSTVAKIANKRQHPAGRGSTTKPGT